jgi:hypothetical protein
VSPACAWRGCPHRAAGEPWAGALRPTPGRRLGQGTSAPPEAVELCCFGVARLAPTEQSWGCPDDAVLVNRERLMWGRRLSGSPIGLTLRGGEREGGSLHESWAAAASMDSIRRRAAGRCPDPLIPTAPGAPRQPRYNCLSSAFHVEQCHRHQIMTSPAGLSSGIASTDVCADAAGAAAESIEPVAAVPGRCERGATVLHRPGAFARPTACCNFGMKHRRLPQSQERVRRAVIADTPGAGSTWNRRRQEAGQLPRRRIGRPTGYRGTSQGSPLEPTLARRPADTPGFPGIRRSGAPYRLPLRRPQPSDCEGRRRGAFWMQPIGPSRRRA